MEVEGTPGGVQVEGNFVAEENSAQVPVSIPEIPPKVSKGLCIFCASVCPASFTVEDGKIIRIPEDDPPVENPNENEVTGEDSQAPPPVSEVGVLERQLRSLFVVRRILDVGHDLCSKLLGDFDGNLDPEHWVNVCDECKSPVYEYYQAQMEVIKLESRMTRIKTKMKELIKESGSGINENPAPGEMEDMSFVVWRSIREEIMRVVPDVDMASPVSPAPPEKAQGQPFQPIFYTFSGNSISIEEFQPIPNSKMKRKSPESNVTPSKRRPTGVVTVKVQDKVVEEAILRKNENLPSSSSSASSSSVLSFPQRRLVYYKCDKCGALVKGKKERIHRHIELHDPKREKGAKGINCEICKWLIYERSLTAHHSLWHSERTPNLSLQNVVIRPFSSWKVTRAFPNYVARKQNNRTVYMCKHCTGLTIVNKKVMEGHSKLHDERGGEICKACGWLVAPGKMGSHFANIHNVNGKINQVNVGPGSVAVDKQPSGAEMGPGEVEKGPGEVELGSGAVDKEPGVVEKVPGAAEKTPGAVDKEQEAVEKAPGAIENGQEVGNPVQKETQQQSPVPSQSKSLSPNRSKPREPSQSKSPEPEHLHKCDDCGELFKTKRRLQTHREMEGGNNNNLEPCIAKRLRVVLFNCDRCGISFKKESWLESHKKMVHVESQQFGGCKNGRRTPKTSTNLKKSGETSTGSTSTPKEIVVIDID